MALSKIRKFKLITGRDLMQQVKELQGIVESENYERYTDLAEPLFHALVLTRDFLDLNEARRVYNDALESHDLGDYKFSMDELGKLIEDAF